MEQIIRKTDLLENFIGALNQREFKKGELISHIADILKIEKESASRRISGKVQFTIREMGILAREMDISLDKLLHANQDYTPILFKMNTPRLSHSINEFTEMIEGLNNELKAAEENCIEMGTIFNSLPTEFYIPHSTLCKFMYFKWGHYFIGAPEFSNFSQCEMPEGLDNTHQTLLNTLRKFSHIDYIWDKSLIWNLANDIKYFKTIFSLTDEETEQIKGELHQMLTNLEVMAQGVRPEEKGYNNIEIYITSLNNGLTSSYHYFNHTYLCFFKTYFFKSALLKDPETGEKVKQWINSLKKVSTLISGGGEKERRLFFEEQHLIVDQI